MDFPDHFSSGSRAYARFRPGYPADLFAFLAAVAPRHRLAWDCATGSGQAASRLATYFERVVASDASLAQIACARRHERLTYVRSLSEASGLATASVDLVSVAQALHWFNLTRFWPEVKRVAGGGGIVAVWCLLMARVSPAVDRIVDRFYEQTVGPFWPSERRLVESGYRGLPFPLERIASPDFEVVRRWDLDHLLGYVATWSATVRCREALGGSPVEDLAAELEGVWGERREVRSVVWPMRLQVGRVK